MQERAQNMRKGALKKRKKESESVKLMTCFQFCFVFLFLLLFLLLLFLLWILYLSPVPTPSMREIFDLNPRSLVLLIKLQNNHRRYTFMSVSVTWAPGLDKHTVLEGKTGEKRHAQIILESQIFVWSLCDMDGWQLFVIL